MTRLSSSVTIFLLVSVYNASVFCDYSNNDKITIFSSLWRTDHAAAKTYHFSKIIHYEPVTEPIVYADGFNDQTKRIVGFNNALVFAYFENEKHYVIQVSEDLDEDDDEIRNYVSQRSSSIIDSGELFDIITLKPTKPTTTTTTTTPFPRFRDMIKDIQRETLPGFDPDKQSLTDYLQQVAINASRLAQSIDQ